MSAVIHFVMLVLQTHNIAMTEPIAEFVVSLKDGRINSQGSLSSAISRSKRLANEAKADMEAMDEVTEAIDAPVTNKPESSKKSDGKLIVAEEIREGHLGWPSCMHRRSQG